LSSAYRISEESVEYTFTSSIYADCKTFHQIGEMGPVAADKDFAYWGTYRFDADPASLTCVLPGLLYKDRNAVYAFGARLGRIDPASFRLLSHPHPCLALAADDRQRFVFESLTGSFMSQPESLGKNAAKLKKVLSITRVPIDGDERHWIEQVSQSFAPLGMHSDEDEETAMIVQDGECRLQTRRRVPCDPASFEVISDCTGRDKLHFFWGSKIIPEVHNASVEHISDVFYKDRNHVFCLSGSYTPVSKADPRTFRFIEESFYPALYAVDDKAGFCLMYGAHRMRVKRFALPNPDALRVIRPEPDSEGRVALGLASDGTTIFKDGVPVKSIPNHRKP
jgi:DKNYY family